VIFYFLTAETQRPQSKDIFSFAVERSANENFQPLRGENYGFRPFFQFLDVEFF
jgi:hypothetical protein